MKIDYVTDLHVNHWMWFTTNQLKWEKRTRDWTRHLIRNGNGEVIIVAGDFSEMNVQSKWVLDELSKHYERVYWTFGNHDLYLMSKKDRKRHGDSKGRLENLIEQTSYLENVIPLIKRTDVYKGVTFAGDAMWYLPKTPEDWAFYKGVSNDSSYITLNSAWSSEDVARQLYKESLDWYDTLDGEEIDVMVSHVPPVHPKLSKYPPNACYMSPVPFLASTHWVCGHDHLQGTFEKAGTMFYMNSVGYPDAYEHARANELPSEDVDPILTFGVQTFEVKKAVPAQNN
jgi:predicted MPP superfamily phosphohydrolase